MSPILHPQMQARVGFLTYRYRFLAVYTVIGVASLFLEFLIKRGLDASGLAPIAAQLLGVLGSVVFAWWMNVRFNFKVPSSKRNRAFVYFFLLSAAPRQCARLRWHKPLPRPACSLENCNAGERSRRQETILPKPLPGLLRNSIPTPSMAPAGSCSGPTARLKSQRNTRRPDYVWTTAL